MVKVKICGLTRSQDVELAVELGADALGFIYEPDTPRYVGSGGLDASLLACVEPYAVTVGVYGRYGGRADLCAFVQAAQWGDKGVGSLSRDTRPGMLSFRFREGTVLQEALGDIQKRPQETLIHPVAVVLDGLSDKGFGGTGVKVDWSLAEEIVQSCPLPVILAGGLTPDNVALAIHKVRPYAVDVSSGIESSPGVKDPAKMRDFIQAARAPY